MHHFAEYSNPDVKVRDIEINATDKGQEHTIGPLGWIYAWGDGN